eukprot:6301348-Prymnesium_polylepis.2
MDVLSEIAPALATGSVRNSTLSSVTRTGISCASYEAAALLSDEVVDGLTTARMPEALPKVVKPFPRTVISVPPAVGPPRGSTALIE